MPSLSRYFIGYAHWINAVHSQNKIKIYSVVPFAELIRNQLLMELTWQLIVFGDIYSDLTTFQVSLVSALCLKVICSQNKKTVHDLRLMTRWPEDFLYQWNRNITTLPQKILCMMPPSSRYFKGSAQCLAQITPLFDLQTWSGINDYWSCRDSRQFSGKFCKIPPLAR